MASENGKATTAPTLAELATLVQEVGKDGGTIEQAIADTERRLKMLRCIRDSLGKPAEPKPRTKATTTA